MLLKHLFLAGIGLLSGFAVAAGAFALIVALTITPRIIGKTSTASKILGYENVIIAGGVLGNIVAVYPELRLPFGSPLLILYGFFGGVYVGCLIMALSEIMNVFPIMFRRLNLKMGMSVVITFFAAGKVAGGLFYFWRGIGS